MGYPKKYWEKIPKNEIAKSIEAWAKLNSAAKDIAKGLKVCAHPGCGSLPMSEYCEDHRAVPHERRVDERSD